MKNMKTKRGNTRLVEVLGKNGTWEYWCVCYKSELDYQINCACGYAEKYRWRFSGSDSWHYGSIG